MDVLGSAGSLMGENSVKLSWEDVKRVRGLTRMKLVLKGIVTREDAALAVQHGIDGIIVSNHGGRAEESGRGTIECLPEVVDAVQGRIPILIDGVHQAAVDTALLGTRHVLRVPLTNIIRELRQYQTAGCEHVALEVSYSTYPAILETIDIIAEEIRPALEQQRER